MSGSGQTVYIEVDNKIVRYFVWAALIWGLVGLLVGALAALQLAWWPANMGLPYLSFGRLRPLHTSAVIFAFGGNAIFASMYYSFQRLLSTRMWSDRLSWVNFWGWQLIIVAVAVTYPLGFTQAKEYAEMEWPIDLAVAVVWVLMIANFIGTIAIRRVKHLYVAIWFFLASILTIALLHVVNNLSLPVAFLKSYPVYAGVQDALVQWWYGHNAVGFLLTTPFLGMMYYFVPKAVNRPVYSYRLSIIHFWSLIFIYIWTGPHHLLYTALPEWVQSVGMVFSLMLIAPSWGGMLNGLLTLRGSWDRVKRDPVIKFFVLALTFYGMATLEGPLLSVKSLNLITHNTDYIIAHVHGGALGWVGGMIFGVVYWLVPRLYRTELYSEKLAQWHFWTATIGLVLYVLAMWTSGLVQGTMWFATDADGLLKYPNFLESVLAVNFLHWIRLAGGILYIVGFILCLVNVFKTSRQGRAEDSEIIIAKAERDVNPTTWHERLENHGLTFGILMGLAVLIGTVLEFVPIFAVEANIPTITAVKPYSPLELAGRDLYIREGCYNCHTQMVRTHALETKRYGERSFAGEYVYDHPFQWGSKRTGPDLHRVGRKYPDFWHYKHLLDPRSTSPGSNMPAYPWLAGANVDTADIAPKLDAMATLGVPYAKEVLSDPLTPYRSQAQAVADALARDGVHIDPGSELVALIAYLQRLGTDLKTLDAKDLDVLREAN